MGYNPNLRDQVRRLYLQKGPCQPRGHTFPQKQFGRKRRRFLGVWFDDFPTWLEYSIKKDAAYCLCCYLFKPPIGDLSGGDFIYEGFSNWKKKRKLRDHVGGPNSSHNQTWGKCQDLLNQRQHIQTVFDNQSSQARIEYRIRLNATIDCIRFLLKQGLAFRGLDESEDLQNQGNFRALLRFLADHNEEVKGVTFDNAPQNLKLTSPKIQKDIVSVAATETIKAIVEDLDGALFYVLVDEARDISIKEQMAIAICYVDKRGNVIERFLGIEHVANTNALTLKEAMESLFSRLGLSSSRLRGQGYDGASNMQGEFNGLKSLILRDSPKKYEQINMLFYFVNRVVVIVSASCKRRDILRDNRILEVMKSLDIGELSSGKGLNQETNLIRAGDTRWGSHYGTLVRLVNMFSSVIEVLEFVSEDRSNTDQKAESNVLLENLQSFEFVFNLHLMRVILAITSELSLALQRKDQDIVNAMALVTMSKSRLRMMRNTGWESSFDDVNSFCKKKEIHIPNMDDKFVARGRGRRNASHITNLHHYRIELFNTVLDMQLSELNSRFSEAATELLLCVACLNPCNSFSSFDKKLIRLAELYPNEFSPVELMVLPDQLDTYIFDMRTSNEFSSLNGIADLSRKMLETERDKVYPFVYLLLTLALILPVATATVERVFSAMNIVKDRLRNRMSNQWLNDSLVVYVERDFF
ncbi:hypothetical protein RHMOL_Rhmol12G0119600 [Rhododendron molle]|uniref:Uncharacterized protein n=1 Tax=Rhododendron molle TaxID=49168 RepID=A0ACC0LGY8_RHOML|nr:hypothetical protein RHMOL_Rhmol12G0119600 [Rhododendron molle]